MCERCGMLICITCLERNRCRWSGHQSDTCTVFPLDRLDDSRSIYKMQENDKSTSGEKGNPEKKKKEKKSDLTNLYMIQFVYVNIYIYIYVWSMTRYVRRYIFVVVCCCADLQNQPKKTHTPKSKILTGRVP